LAILPPRCAATLASSAATLFVGALALSHGVPARAGKISGGAGTQPIAEILNYMVDGLAYHRRVSCGQFRVSREVRRARDGFTLEPR